MNEILSSVPYKVPKINELLRFVQLQVLLRRAEKEVGDSAFRSK